MGATALSRLINRLLSLMILLSTVLLNGVAPVEALQLPWAGGEDRRPPALPVNGPSGRLQEVAAPGAVQQLRRQLASHQPRLSLASPSDGSVINGDSWTLTLIVEDWPVAEDPDLGLGAHIALQIDNGPPQRFAVLENGRIQATLPALSPGSHRLSAYAAYPWGEAVKAPGASLQWRLDQLQGLRGTQPEQDDPWLVLVSPAELGSGEPLLLDWLVWNAPLQNLRDGDARWRIRLTLNGDSFLMDRQEALWIRSQGSGTQTVQMELLDGLGEPITPVFNNQLRAVPNRRSERPVWMQSSLSDNQIARLLGQALPEPEPVPEPEPLPEQEPEPEPEPQPEAEQASEPEAVPTPTPLPQAMSPERKAPITRAEPPPLTPSTSLGGSARELLNADGTQR